MKLTPYEILKHLGINVPQDGLHINPHDAYLHLTLLRLLGEQMSVGAIKESGLTELHIGLYGAHRGPGAVVPEADSETLRSLRATLHVIQQQVLGMVAK
ncbi:hypothetical protein RPSD_52450 (plasmid) [Ralstonia solanacearum]|nr:hypothetical protein RPSD_52450 [Ralstonia solanacearum]